MAMLKGSQARWILLAVLIVSVLQWLGPIIGLSSLASQLAPYNWLFGILAIVSIYAWYEKLV